MSHFEKRFKEYQNKTYANKKEILSGLKDGQSPKTFLITCADSRISVADICDAEPGDIFVIRNAGNVIEAYNKDNPSNEALTLEYGVSALNVEEVIVCGHKSCGAMGGVKDLDGLSALPLVQSGLRRVSAQFSDLNLSEISLDDLIVENVKRQLLNIYSYPFVKEKVTAGKLNLVGHVYDFVGGELTTTISIKELV